VSSTGRLRRRGFHALEAFAAHVIFRIGDAARLMRSAHPKRSATAFSTIGVMTIRR